MATPGQRRLPVDLPNEIIALVLEELAKNTKKAIANLRLTCKRLHDVSEPVFFRSILLESTFPYDDAQHCLNVRQERHSHVQDLTMVYGFGISKHHPSMPQCLGSFKNLKSMRISAFAFNDYQDFRLFCTILDYQLTTNAFSELKECSISLKSFDKTSALKISSLLKACKLSKLALHYIDLRDINSTSSLIGHHSCLKELELNECAWDATTLAAILAVPSKLETFAVEMQIPKRRHSPNLYDEQLETLQKTINLLSEKQKSLKTLKLTVDDWDRYYFNLSQTLDFTGLHGVKEMSFKTTGGRLPFMPFENLPNCERLEIFLTEPVSLLLIARNLKEHRSNGGSSRVPKSLRRLDIFADDRDGSYDGFRFSENAKIRVGMKELMEILEIPHLTYTQQGGSPSWKTFSAEWDPTSTDGDIAVKELSGNQVDAVTMYW
ncbi:hypothetical protein H2200_004603 [Cladophialophora chaetospira]|uniref:F-box domain-containing protein n=1 Tax=Cladophialophora chaetospira TaxID=386627 RepID=A0AA39CKL8_9EURO|nr:hypothetical protein H2200_004603 [Cladophialophora chaetospira]